MASRLLLAASEMNLELVNEWLDDQGFPLVGYSDTKDPSWANPLASLILDEEYGGLEGESDAVEVAPSGDEDVVMSDTEDEEGEAVEGGHELIE